MKRIVLFIVGAMFGLLCSTLHAQVPNQINYQGRLLVGTTTFNGTGQFKFALVDGAGTTTFWSNDNTGTNGGEPSNPVSVTVTNGLYSVLLGDTTLANMTAIPYIVFEKNSDVRLRVWFNDGTNGSQLLSPDQRVASVGYAVLAAAVGDHSTGAIVSTTSDVLQLRGPGGINFNTSDSSNSVDVTTGQSMGNAALFIGGGIIADHMIAGGVTAAGNDLTVKSTITAGSGINSNGIVVSGGLFQIFPDGFLQGASANFKGSVGVVGDVSARSFITTSDRNAKEQFRPVDGRKVLSHLVSLPIQTWIFKQDDAGVQHIGPMAQDFYAAFQVGPDNKHITTVDADGVSFAAIQGLNEIVQEQNAVLAAKAKKIDALEKRLDEIEKTLKQTPSSKMK